MSREKSSTGHAPVKCIGCISLSPSLPPSPHTPLAAVVPCGVLRGIYTGCPPPPPLPRHQHRATLDKHTFVHIYRRHRPASSAAVPLFKTAAPRVYGGIPHPTPPHPTRSPHPRATFRAVRFLRAASFSLLYQCYAPTTASRQATGGGAVCAPLEKPEPTSTRRRCPDFHSRLCPRFRPTNRAFRSYVFAVRTR